MLFCLTIYEYSVHICKYFFINRVGSNGIIRNCMGDLSSGRAFDNGCTCFDSCQGVVNDLRGKRIECTCKVSNLLNSFHFS